MRELMLPPKSRVLLRHLETTGHITSRSAIMDHSIGSLTKEINRLRNFGIKIDTVTKYHPITGQRYADYVLVRDPENYRSLPDFLSHRLWRNVNGPAQMSL